MTVDAVATGYLVLFVFSFKGRTLRQSIKHSLVKGVVEFGWTISSVQIMIQMYLHANKTVLVPTTVCMGKMQELSVAFTRVRCYSIYLRLT